MPPDEIGATGICGSAIIEAVAELFMAGHAAAGWPLRPAMGTRYHDHPAPSHPPRNGAQGRIHPGHRRANRDRQQIVVTQDDVRNIQLAKAALYAGCKLLMRRRGVDTGRQDRAGRRVRQLYRPAARDGAGAVPRLRARPGLRGRQRRRRRRTHRAAEQGPPRRGRAAPRVRVEYVETAIDPLFQEEFVAAMHLPHMTDPFPHLDALDILPARRAPSGDERARRREQRRSAR